jgi:hypothetical protein
METKWWPLPLPDPREVRKAARRAERLDRVADAIWAGFWCVVAVAGILWLTFK